MKRVIFVGGTEFSGSTFFHMILANDPHGLAIGEAHNFMRPSRPYHFDMHCSCGEHPCNLWQHLRGVGEERLYETLFAMFPEIEFIVDSSKYPFWIRDQMANLDRQGIAARNILIWKTPYEFAHSHFKRDDLDSWERSWVGYHRLYYTLFKEWKAIPYWELVENREALRAVCEYLAIADFVGKERYWERSHPQHVVGGNPSARVHLYSQDSSYFAENIRRSSSRIEVASDGTHRSIYYDTAVDPSVRQDVEAAMHENPRILAVMELLESRDLRSHLDGNEVDDALLRVPDPLVRLRHLRYRLVRRLAAIRNAR